jgi:excisionase family DNA binding protein
VTTVSARELSLHEAADSLGVHYMTAYRYVRLGMLPAVKVGGSWVVTAADVDALRRAGSSPSGSGSGRRRAPWDERLAARLVAGDAGGAWSVVEAALSSGVAVDEIYLDVVAPAMRAIGDGWERGDIDVSVEHRASGIAMRLVGRLGPRFARPGRRRGTVVVGTPPGELHSLPLALFSDLVRGDGWDVTDLGADLPVESFVLAVEAATDLVAVGVSVTSAASLPSAASLLATLGAARAAGRTPDVPVVAGGAAVRDLAHARELGADTWAPSASAFCELWR